MTVLQRDTSLFTEANKQIVSSANDAQQVQAQTISPTVNMSAMNKTVATNDMATANAIKNLTQLAGTYTKEREENAIVEGGTMFLAGKSREEAAAAGSGSMRGYMAQEVISNLNTFNNDETVNLEQSKSIDPLDYAKTLHKKFTDNMPTTGGDEIKALYVKKYSEILPALINEHAKQHQAWISDKQVNSLSRLLVSESTAIDPTTGKINEVNNKNIAELVKSAGGALTKASKDEALYQAAIIEMSNGKGSRIYNAIRDTDAFNSMDSDKVFQLDKIKGAFDKAKEAANKKAIEDAKYANDIKDGRLRAGGYSSYEDMDKAMSAFGKVIQGSPTYTSLLQAGKTEHAALYYDREMVAAAKRNNYVPKELRLTLDSAAANIGRELGQDDFTQVSSLTLRAFNIYKNLGGGILADSSVNDETSRKVLSRAYDLMETGGLDDSTALVTAYDKVSNKAAPTAKEVSATLSNPVYKEKAKSLIKKHFNDMSRIGLDATKLDGFKELERNVSNRAKTYISDGEDAEYAYRKASTDVLKNTLVLKGNLVNTTLDEFNTATGLMATEEEASVYTDAFVNNPKFIDVYKSIAPDAKEIKADYWEIKSRKDINGNMSLALTPVQVEYGFWNDVINNNTDLSFIEKVAAETRSKGNKSYGESILQEVAHTAPEYNKTRGTTISIDPKLIGKFVKQSNSNDIHNTISKAKDIHSSDVRHSFMRNPTRGGKLSTIANYFTSKSLDRDTNIRSVKTLPSAFEEVFFDTADGQRAKRLREGLLKLDKKIVKPTESNNLTDDII